jgi:hypothetical protein
MASAANRLAGATNRLMRAQRHLNEVKQLVSEFRRSNPYSHRIEVYREHEEKHVIEEAELWGTGFAFNNTAEFSLHDAGEGHTEIRLRVVDEFGIKLAVLKEPEVVPLGAAIGDVIHNLRAALDYVVWELSDKFSGPAPQPLPLKDPWRRIQFPVVSDPAHWPGAVSRYLWAVDPKLHARFQRLQPFYPRRKHPQRHWLAVLQELWNGDKHRTVAVVNSLVALDRVHPSDWEWEPSWRFPGEKPLQVQATVLKRRKPGPLEDDAELARVKILAPLFPLSFLQKAMNMNLVFAYDIAFEQGPPAYGAQVVHTLEDFHNRVTAIVLRFKPALG